MGSGRCSLGIERRLPLLLLRRGLAAAPRALEDIYRGANAGKLIIAVP